VVQSVAGEVASAEGIALRAALTAMFEVPPSLTLRLDDLFTDVTAVGSEVRRGAA
jgi:hypothetical protein